MTEEFVPTLTYATERGIDVLLVEEFFAFADVCVLAANARRFACTDYWLDGSAQQASHAKPREIDIFIEGTERMHADMIKLCQGTSPQ